MTDKQRKICEDLGWKIYEDEDDEYITLSQDSPLGEDFSFEVNPKNITEDVRDRWLHFDPDKHAVEWFNAKLNGDNSIPWDLRSLLDDAEEIGEMLDRLATALEQEED